MNAINFIFHDCYVAYNTITVVFKYGALFASATQKKVDELLFL
jgi:hypothetical protein